MWSAVLVMAVSFSIASAAAVSRTPPNPVDITMYNLRPYNLTADISEKDSADALGDIFFYITDRLVTPYACRHGSQTDPPFMCRDFQKILQTNDQVYTEIRVQVDSTFGGCANGSYSCSQYADCNPDIHSNSSVDWKCSCGRPGVHECSSTKDYWHCSADVAELCGTAGGSQCRSCVAQHRHGILQACSDDSLSRSCSENWQACLGSMYASKCNQKGQSQASCLQCAFQDPRPKAANCSAFDLEYLCQPPKNCAATGKLTVFSRYCDSTDDQGLCIKCADGCGGIWSHWKSQVSLLGGLWYSTPKEGNCEDPNQHCAWKVLQNVKTVNASCANNNLHVAVEKKGHGCFSQCAQPRNVTSDCWILCFIETTLGRDPLNLSRVVGTPMTAEELSTPWLQAFESEDPAKGGCAALPPAAPHASEELVV